MDARRFDARRSEAVGAKKVLKDYEGLLTLKKVL